MFAYIFFIHAFITLLGAAGVDVNIAPIFTSNTTHALRAAQLRGPHYFAVGMRSVGEKIVVSVLVQL